MCARRQNNTNGHSAVQSTSLSSSPLAALPPALRELVHGMTDPHTSTCTYHCALSFTDKHFNDLALKNASDVKLFHPQLTHWCVQPHSCTQETAHALCALHDSPPRLCFSSPWRSGCSYGSSAVPWLSSCPSLLAASQLWCSQYGLQAIVSTTAARKKKHRFVISFCQDKSLKYISDNPSDFPFLGTFVIQLFV